MISEWDDYIAARESGIKVKWKPLLAERLAYIASLKENEKKEYLNRLCHYYFDLGKIEIPIQHPEIWNDILTMWKSDLNWDDEKLLLWLFKALSFKGAYLLFEKDPRDILRRVVELNPDNIQAKILLIKEHLHTLDFSMHSIDSGMLIEKAAGDEIIAECEKLIIESPELKECKSQYGSDFFYYRDRFLAWFEYAKQTTSLDFDDWYNEKM